MSLHTVLARGYFPKELPRPFITTSFANHLASAAVLPGDFAKTAAKGNKLPTAKTTRYSHARSGLFRRTLSICNPVHHFLLAKEIVGHWSSISAKASGSSLAATWPEFKSKGRAIDGKWPQSARPSLAQSSRLGRRYTLQTDITRFYHSIYTHSIAWSLHSKALAKKNQSLSLLGNKLDYWVRMGQDRQTMGIPIGPDTSLVLAELIMHRIDEELAKRIPTIKGHRFIDDYELSFRTRTEAEDAFHVLETCLADYELALNPKKTNVLELPLPLEPAWATELRRFSFRSSKAGQASDLSNFFTTAFALHLKNRDDSVLQFAIAKLRSVKVDPTNWPLLQRLLLLCVEPEPATLPYALEQMIFRKNAGAPGVLPELAEILNSLIFAHAELKHSSEVANALWACLALNLQIESKSVDQLGDCDDPIVALLALHCDAQGLMAKPVDKTVWAAHMTSASLYNEYWLLAYEANVKGWLPSVGGTDHVAGDTNFGFLKAAGVSFYDTALAVPPPASPVPLPTLPTLTLTTSVYSP